MFLLAHIIVYTNIQPWCALLTPHTATLRKKSSRLKSGKNPPSRSCVTQGVALESHGFSNACGSMDKPRLCPRFSHNPQMLGHHPRPHPKHHHIARSQCSAASHTSGCSKRAGHHRHRMALDHPRCCSARLDRLVGGADAKRHQAVKNAPAK